MVLTMDLTLLLGYWSQARNNSLRSPLLTFTRSEKNYKTVKDFLTSSASSSPVRERASLGISAVKSLVLRGKEEKVAAEFIDDEAWALIQSILDVEGLTTGRKVGIFVENLPGTMTLPRDIHGAPPHSLIVKISEVMGSFKTLRKMALFWCRLVAEVLCCSSFKRIVRDCFSFDTRA